MLLLWLMSYALPFDSPLTDNIEYLEIRGLVDIPSVRPYTMEWIIPQLDDVLTSDTKINDVDRTILSHFTPLVKKNEDFSYLLHASCAHQTKPEYTYGLLDYRLGGRVARTVWLSHGVRFQRASELDPFGPRSWKNFQVYLTEGLLEVQTENLHVACGRRNILLGPGPEDGLLLSLDPQGYDGGTISIHSRYLEFFGLFSVLDASARRYLSVHRIGLHARKFFNIGFSEAIVFGQSLEPLYLNLFMPFYLAQWGKNRDDNILWSIDMQVRLFHALFWGELLIDDYMYEHDPYPNKLGYRLGWRTLIAHALLAGLDYVYVDTWVYTHHETLINTYERNGRPLGFPLGNDVDRLSASVKYMTRFGIYPSLVLSYVRKGEGSIFVPYEEEGGPVDPPFPSGIVEKTFEVSFGLNYTFTYRLYLHAEIGRRWLTNYGHISGDNRNETLLAIGVWAPL